jgi:uncharacterized membrane protein
MSPFDWRSIVFAKHAQHVVLIHFPIALYLAAVCLDASGLWLKKPNWVEAAYYNLTLAALSTFPAVVTGLAAWQWQLEGHRLQGLLLYHMLSALAAAVFIWLSWWLHFRHRRAGKPPLTAARIAMEVTGTMVIALAGHLGGFLSGVNT